MVRNDDNIRIECPSCSEKILPNAKKCRYCGEWIKDTKRIKFKFSKKYIFLFIALSLCLLFFYQYLTTIKNSSTTNNETGLRKTVERQYSLLNSEEGIREIYRNYLAPESKTMTEEKYLSDFKDRRKTNNINYSKVEIHSILVNGNIGFVDRTLYDCEDSLCNKVVDKARYFKKYVYFSGKWLMAVQGVMCPRDSMYDMPSEFERAVKLILQRTASPKSIFEDIQNCIDVEYSKTDAEMDGAEGMFRFIRGQSADNLKILVSPRYSLKDDLITSVLLTHEITHANNYANSLLMGEDSDCYEDEAWAFNNQIWYLSLLNNEERSSIFSRSAFGGSDELKNIVYVWNSVPKFSGSTGFEKSLNFVKSNPAYIDQCSK